ncbi:hypothetical protein HAX54_011079, partial [Datura stramonium]|nr:hypothetical protein [Datura stramonium]
ADLEQSEEVRRSLTDEITILKELSESSKEKLSLGDKLKKYIEIESKGKKSLVKLQAELEDELEKTKLSLLVELERNEDHKKELLKVKADLEMSLKWTWSSQALASANKRFDSSKEGLGFSRAKVPYDPH